MGQLLIAQPSLHKSFFEKAIVLISEHDYAGAKGYLLNHPTTHHVRDFLSDTALRGLGDIPVFIGGPVGQKNLTFHALWSSETTQGIDYRCCLAAEEALRLAEDPLVNIKAVLGYCGWSGGQLEDELKHQSWVVSPPPELLLSQKHNASLWRKLLATLSPAHRLMAMCPDKPWLN